MLTPPPSLPGVPLAALLPTLELLRRHARERRHRVQLGTGLFDETLARSYAASETSLTLLLEHVLAPLFLPQPDAVNVTEEILLAVRVLERLVQHVTMPDQATPKITVAQGGYRWMRPPQEAALLVQVTLAAIQAALLDGALFLVVSLPRQADTGLAVDVEADAAGLVGQHGEVSAARQQLAACLAPLGGELRGDAHPGSFRLSIWIPA